MRLKFFIDEAILTPAPINWKDIERAILIVWDKFEKYSWTWLAKDLHRELENNIQNASWLNIRLIHNPKIRGIGGSVGSDFRFYKGKNKRTEIDPRITIEHNWGTTFLAWKQSEGTTRKATFKAWLSAFKATVYHELVHAAQYVQIWEKGKLKNPKEFENLISRSHGYQKWSDEKKEWIITNYEKYHADGLEIMAYAQGTAIELFKWGNEIKDMYAANPGKYKKYEDETGKKLRETGDVAQYIISNIKDTKKHPYLTHESDSWSSYYHMRKKYPRIWKKFVKYLVQYIQHHGNLSEGKKK